MLARRAWLLLAILACGSCASWRGPADFDLIVRGVEARHAAMLFITHDLSVVATVCERVLVMYGGRMRGLPPESP